MGRFKSGRFFTIGNIANVCFLFAVTMLASCSDSVLDSQSKNDSPSVPLSALALQNPEDCADLKNYIVTSIIKRYTTIPRYSYYYCPTSSRNGGVEGPVPAPTSPDDSVLAGDGAGGGGNTEGAPADVSGTNNQEAGVNEGDIVKADERGIVYIVSGNHLVIAKGYPPRELTTLKEIDLGAHGMQLFLDKRDQLDENNNIVATQYRLVVVARYDLPYYILQSNTDSTRADAAIYPPIQEHSMAAIFYDVSTPEAPVMLDQIRFKGHYQTGRRIDDRLHLVLRDYYYPDELYQDADFWRLSSEFRQAVNKAQCENPDADPDTIAAHPAVIAAKAAVAAKVTAVFDTISIEDYLPTAHRPNNEGVLEQIPFLACSDIMHTSVNSNLGLQVITSVDTDGQNLGATAMINNAWQTYVSRENLYVAETSWNWWWQNVDGTLPTSQTAIYKFAVSADKPVFVSTGTVVGYARNQFSFSEHNGALRVSTTQNDWFFATDDSTGAIMPRREVKNNVFVLQDNNTSVGEMEVIGSVSGFGADETIRSTRFLGDRGFVVTFRQTDPLFTFDLSNPKDPKLMGELEIPGFSSYMHAYDDNHLITIGRAGGANGVGIGSGIQLQMFDVTDLAAPKLLHSLTPAVPSGWSWSSAEYDHKAFTFYKPANLLAIPMQFRPDYTTSVFSGIVAYKVSLEAFTEIGKVDHSDLAKQYYCDPNVALSPSYASYCDNGYYVMWAAPRRSLVMTSNADDVYLYTISDVGMKASNIADLGTTLGRIIFPPQSYWWWYYGVADMPLMPADSQVVF